MKRHKRALALSLALVCITAGAVAGDRNPKPANAGQKQWPAKAKTIYIEMTFAFREGNGNDVGSGTIKMWFDPGRGLYRASAVIRMALGDEQRNMEAHFVLTPKGAIEWQRMDGALEGPRSRDLKSKPGQPPQLEKSRELGPILIPFTEAAFGYGRLKKELVMEKAKSPLPKPDKLKWHEIKLKDKKKETRLFKAISFSMDGGRVWMGLSPKTGWPMKHVVRAARGGHEMVLTVTKLDLKANLKGAFDIPADVRAKLDEDLDEEVDEELDEDD